MAVERIPRFLRYLAPNLITLSSMIFGLVSLYSSSRGPSGAPLAAWMIIYAVLTDRLDGLTARAMKATSELGMQLDSFADFLNFGIAPAYLVLQYVGHRVPYYQEGTGHFLLFAACGAYMLCAVFRLARYNVLSDDQVPTKIFFGFPTTLTGGLVAIWFLLLLKYDPDPSTPVFGGRKLFGDSLHTPFGVWKYLPLALVIGGYLMASRLPMPKVGMTKNKAISIILFVLLTTGYICGFAMIYPEICFWMPTVWSVMFLVWGQASAKARAMYPPPLFPRQVEGKTLERPQEDLEDIVLDENRQSSPALDPSGAAAAAPSSAKPASSSK